MLVRFVWIEYNKCMFMIHNSFLPFPLDKEWTFMSVASFSFLTSPASLSFSGREWDVTGVVHTLNGLYSSELSPACDLTPRRRHTPHRVYTLGCQWFSGCLWCLLMEGSCVHCRCGTDGWKVGFSFQLACLADRLYASQIFIDKIILESFRNFTTRHNGSTVFVQWVRNTIELLYMKTQEGVQLLKVVKQTWKT